MARTLYVGNYRGLQSRDLRMLFRAWRSLSISVITDRVVDPAGLALLRSGMKMRKR